MPATKRANKKVHPVVHHWRRWKYKNTALLAISLLVLVYVAQTPAIDTVVRSIGTLGYLGAVITGLFFVSTFTVAPAAVVLYHLADVLHPIEVALLAGFGAMLGDYIIFRFLKDRIFEELSPLFRRLHTKRTRLLFKSPYFVWLLPVLGAIVIASPLPDEIGVSMLGLSRIKRWHFLAIAFVLNSIGILVIVSAARMF